MFVDTFLWRFLKVPLRRERKIRKRDEMTTKRGVWGRFTNERIGFGFMFLCMIFSLYSYYSFIKKSWYNYLSV